MKSTFVRLTDTDSADEKRIAFRESRRWFNVDQSRFLKIPGTPIAYWVSTSVVDCFSRFEPIGKRSKKGLSCGQSEMAYRYWFEIDDAGMLEKWIPISKGGPFRKWFGNAESVVRWAKDGQWFLTQHSGSVIRNEEYYLMEYISWNDIGTTAFHCRYTPSGSIITDSGPGIFGDAKHLIACALNSEVSKPIIDLLCPTLHFGVGQLSAFPIPFAVDSEVDKTIYVAFKKLVSISESDWDLRETSWGFRRSPLLTDYAAEPTRTAIDENLTDVSWPSAVGMVESLAEAYQSFVSHWTAQFLELHRLEEENNRIFIDLYGLQEELTPDVPYSEVTILQDELDDKARKNSRIEFKKDEVMRQFVSYGVGCIFGRYSLDKDGLILANAGDDLDAYLSQIPEPTLPPDESGILPITDDNDFADELPSQWCAFLRAAFGDEHYEENLRFLEDGLGKRLRQYFLKGFYDDHVKRYKKRPIYWLITSPKGTLQALIYLHRYNRDTVNRFLNDYLRPYQQKLEAKRGSAEHVLTGGGSSQSEKTKAQKRIDEIRKALEELSTWERDVVRPLAEKRIELDLDDGVKVNYGKLGAILAKVKGLNG